MKRCYVAEIRFGGDKCEFLSIQLLARSHPQSFDYWDGNWLQARVEMAAGGFDACVEGHLRAEEFKSFYQDLSGVYEKLNGVALFRTMEGWLEIKVLGDGRGHVRFECFLRDNPGIGNTLRFALELDQTFVPPILPQLGKATRKYPVIGKP